MIFRRPLSSSPFGWRNAFSELDRMQRQLQELAGGLAKRPRWPVGARLNSIRLPRGCSYHVPR